MIFFTKNPNLKKNFVVFGRGGGGGGKLGGARVSDFFTKTPYPKGNGARVSDFVLPSIQI